MGTDGLVVAVTGPTGEIGRPFVDRLETVPEVSEIRGMARRPFDPASQGWRKTVYVQGDVLDRTAVERLVADVDVVVHLAFVIFGDRRTSHEVNVRGSRNVFRAAVEAGARRLVYTSSVAAYGFRPENPQPLTEDVPVLGSDEFYYSADKAELEGILAATAAGADLDVYVFRPSIVGGPDSPALILHVPYVTAGWALRGPLRPLRPRIPGTGPVVLDPGAATQLVHADDVATALVAAVCGDGPPGAYNLAADGTITLGDVAAALGWDSVRVPRPVVEALASVERRIPWLPSLAEWIHAVKVLAVMDTTKARAELGWDPQYDAHQTLAATVAGARAAGAVDASGRRPSP